MPDSPTKPRILTGIRANNALTVGNYLGALLPMVDMAKNNADEYHINLFVPDLHSFTTPIDHQALYEQTMNNLRIFVAAGLPLDHPNIHIYRQSYVPAHSELTWILDCFTGFGEMSRMTQFKDKSGQIEKSDNPENGRISVGLFNYPVLMAADILLYGARYVPVGDDQTQHLEFARDIAQRINKQFGNLFTVPLPVAKQHQFFGKDQGLRVRDLINPDKKMSKSDETGKGVIFLTDTPQAAAKKIKSATTDSMANIQFDFVGQPGISNLLQLLALLSGQDQQKVIAKYQGQTQYAQLKEDTAQAVSIFLTDFQAKLSAVDTAAILQKLQSSEAAMNKIANTTLYKVQQAVGLRPSTNHEA